MRLLIFGDLMGSFEIMQQIANLNLKKYDFLLYTGDTPNPSVFKALREVKIEQGINQDTNIEKDLIEDTAPTKALKKATIEVQKILDVMRKIDKPIYGVLGNADLRYYEKYIEWPFTLLHNKVTAIGKYNFVGYDGRPKYIFENQNDNERTFPEGQVEKDLLTLLQGYEPTTTILVTHTPPRGMLDQVKLKMRGYATGTYGENVKDGRIGSTGIRNAVDTYKPLLHIFGHIHEAVGVVRQETTFVNAGSTGENRKVVDLEIVDDMINIDFKTI